MKVNSREIVKFIFVLLSSAFVASAASVLAEPSAKSFDKKSEWQDLNEKATNVFFEYQWLLHAVAQCAHGKAHQDNPDAKENGLTDIYTFPKPKNYKDWEKLVEWPDPVNKTKREILPVVHDKLFYNGENNYDYPVQDEGAPHYWSKPNREDVTTVAPGNSQTFKPPDPNPVKAEVKHASAEAGLEFMYARRMNPNDPAKPNQVQTKITGYAYAKTAMPQALEGKAETAWAQAIASGKAKVLQQIYVEGESDDVSEIKGTLIQGDIISEARDGGKGIAHEANALSASVIKDPISAALYDATGRLLWSQDLFDLEYTAVNNAKVFFAEGVGLTLVAGFDSLALVDYDTVGLSVLNPFNGFAEISEGLFRAEGYFANMPWVVSQDGDIVTAFLPISAWDGMIDLTYRTPMLPVGERAAFSEMMSSYDAYSFAIATSVPEPSSGLMAITMVVFVTVRALLKKFREEWGAK